jgi:hypothetical protein
MSILKQAFIRLTGPRALLFLGDTPVFDRWIRSCNPWALTVPLRLIPPSLDNRNQAYPRYSICMLATKTERS